MPGKPMSIRATSGRKARSLSSAPAALLRRLDLVARVDEQQAQSLARVRVVLDDQDALADVHSGAAV